MGVIIRAIFFVLHLSGVIAKLYPPKRIQLAVSKDQANQISLHINPDERNVDSTASLYYNVSYYSLNMGIGAEAWFDNAVAGITCTSNHLRQENRCSKALSAEDSKVWRNDIEAPSDYLEFDFQKLVTLTKIKWQCSDDYGVQSAIQDFRLYASPYPFPDETSSDYLLSLMQRFADNDPVPGTLKNDGTPDMRVRTNKDWLARVEAAATSNTDINRLISDISPRKGKMSCNNNGNIFSFAAQTGRYFRLEIDSNFMSNSRALSLSSINFFGQSNAIRRIGARANDGNSTITLNAPRAVEVPYVVSVKTCDSNALCSNSDREESYGKTLGRYTSLSTRMSYTKRRKNLYQDYYTAGLHSDIKTENWYYDSAVSSTEYISCTERNNKILNPGLNRRSYSSSYDSNHKNSLLDGHFAWSVGNSNRYSTNNWAQIDSGRSIHINGIVTQMRSNMNQRVKTLKIQVSDDGNNFENVDNGKIFDANIQEDYTKKVTIKFSKTYIARYIRVIPQTWHGWQSMRFGILGCDDIPTEAVSRAFTFEADPVLYQNGVRMPDPFSLRPTAFSQVNVVGELPKTIAFGRSNVGFATKHFLDTCEPNFIPLVKTGTYGSLNTSKMHFNNQVLSSTLGYDGQGAIIRRECRNCMDSHKVIYYKRLTPIPSSISMYDLFMYDFDINIVGNRFNIDFELYGSWDDALKYPGKKWKVCTYEDDFKAFPAMCGKAGETKETATDRNHIQFSVYVGDAMASRSSTTVPTPVSQCFEMHGPYRNGESVKFNMTLEKEANRTIHLKMRLYEVGVLAYPQHFIVEVNGKTIFKNDPTGKGGCFNELKHRSRLSAFKGTSLSLYGPYLSDVLSGAEDQSDYKCFYDISEIVSLTNTASVEVLVSKRGGSALGVVRSTEYIKQCVADGTSYQVKMEWPAGAEGNYPSFAQFTVPAGHNIFAQTEMLNIPIYDVSSSDPTVTFADGKGKFCHACVNNGANRWGDSCWAITPEADSNRQCGCNSGGWAGTGIYYGGKKNNNKCAAQGGGFVGPRTNGQSKGNMNSIGLTIYVRCGESDGWTRMLSEEPGTGNGLQFDDSAIRHLDISSGTNRRELKSSKPYAERSKRRLVEGNALCHVDDDPKTFEYLFKKGSYGDLNVGKEAFDRKSLESTCSNDGVGVILKRECSGCGNDHKLIFYKRKKVFGDTSMYDILLDTWRSSNNEINNHFELYSTLEDALKGNSRWSYCNYNDNKIAFPRDCGKTGGVWSQWTSFTRGGQQHYAWSVLNQVGAGKLGLQSWWGFDTFSLDEIVDASATDSLVGATTFSVDAETPTLENIKGANITHYLVKHTNVLVSVKNPSLRKGNLVGSSRCPAQFLVKFDMTVHSSIADTDNYYNLVYISPRRADTGEEKSRHLLISLKANRFHISQSFESTTDYISVNSKRTIAELQGRTVAIVFSFENGKRILTVNGEDWINEIFSGENHPNAFDASPYCKVWLGADFGRSPSIDIDVQDFAFEEIIRPLKNYDTVLLASSYDGVSTVPSDGKITFPRNYRLAFDFTVTKHVDEGSHFFSNVFHIGLKKSTSWPFNGGANPGYGARMILFSLHKGGFHLVYQHNKVNFWHNPSQKYTLNKVMRIEIEVAGTGILFSVNGEIWSQVSIPTTRATLADLEIGFDDSRDANGVSRWKLKNWHFEKIVSPIFDESSALISSVTFDDENQNGWSCNGITTCRPIGKICGGTGKIGKNEKIEKKFTGLVAGRTYLLSLDFLKIDSWDNGDYGEVLVNGEQCWKHTFGRDEVKCEASRFATYVHDGHCNGGFLKNTEFDSICDCAKHCLETNGCGYIGYRNNGERADGLSTNCALYTAAAACPDDDDWGMYNSYAVIAQPPGSCASHYEQKIYCKTTLANTDELLVIVTSNLQDGANDESFAVDNVTLTEYAFNDETDFDVNKVTLLVNRTDTNERLAGLVKNASVLVATHNLDVSNVKTRISACNKYGCSPWSISDSSMAPKVAPRNVRIRGVNSNALEISVHDPYLVTGKSDDLVHYRINPPQTCRQLKDVMNISHDEQHYIQPISGTVVLATCTADGMSDVACDKLPSGRNAGTCAITSKVTDHNTCKSFGMDIVIPRSKKHLTSLFARYGFLQNFRYYFETIPGIYSDSDRSASIGSLVMNSQSSSDFKALDDGAWWLKDAPVGQTSESYNRKCWLGVTSWNNPVVINSNFENGNHDGWDCGTVHTCGTLGKICGKKQKQQKLERSFAVSPGSYEISLDFIKIDSWDNENAEVDINDKNCWTHTFAYNDGDANLCNAGWHEQKTSVSCSVDIKGPENTLKLSVRGYLNSGYGDEGWAVDNIKIIRTDKPELNVVDHYKFDTSNCDFSTKRYVCGANSQTNSNGRKYMPFGIVPLSTRKLAMRVNGAYSQEYFASISACNKYGCGPATTVQTSVPFEATAIEFMPHAGGKFIFKGNLSKEDGGFVVDKIKVVVESYSSTGEIKKEEVMHARVDPSADHEIVRVTPPIDFNRPSKFSFYPCNVLGCATSSPLAWNVGIDAKISVENVIHSDNVNGVLTLELKSVTDSSKVDPTNTLLYFSVFDNAQANASIGSFRLNSVALSKSEGTQKYLYMSSKIVNISLPYLGAISYKIEALHCLDIDNFEICSRRQFLQNTILNEVPLPVNDGAAPAASAVTIGGRIKIHFKQTPFWGSGAETNGRKIVIQMNEFVDNASVPITSIITFDEVVPDTTESSYTYGVVSGLLRKNAYTFSLASQNGDSDARRSAWTKFSNRVHPIATTPESPTILKPADEDRFGDGINLKAYLSKRDWNGSPPSQYMFQAYKLSSCGTQFVDWDANQNSTKTKIIDDRSSEIQEYRYGDLEDITQYVFHARAVNAEGVGPWSPCCTDDDIVTTTRIEFEVRIRPRESDQNLRGSMAINGGRRLSNSSNDTSTDVVNYGPIQFYMLQNPFEGVSFILNSGRYLDSNLVFSKRNMVLRSSLGLGPEDVIIDCQRQRCFNFLQGYVPNEIQGIKFVNAFAPASSLTGPSCRSGDCGAVIYIDGSSRWLNPLVIRNCIFNGHISSKGGAIYIASSTQGVTLHNLHFSNNRANITGGAMVVDSANIYGKALVFKNNHAGDKGGAISIVGIQQAAVCGLDDTTFEDNTVQGDGGAVFTEASKVQLTRCSATNNLATNSGGFLEAVTSNLVFQDVVVSGAKSNVGGVGCYGSQIDATNLEMQYGKVTGDGGGGIYGILCNAIVKNSTFSYNQACEDPSVVPGKPCRHGKSSGGAILMDLKSSISSIENTFLGNEVSMNGGAIYLRNMKNAYFRNNNIRDNKATRGGGIFVSDTAVTVMNSTFTSNMALGGGGGAIYWAGDFMPVDIDVEYLDNNAWYGENKATNARYVVVSPQHVGVRNDQLFELNAKLADHYGNLYLDESFEVELSAFSDEILVSNSGLKKMYKASDPDGVEFDSLLFRSVPGNHTIAIGATAATIESAISKVDVHECSAGERLSPDQQIEKAFFCEKCPVGTRQTFKTTDSVEIAVCSSCPSNEVQGEAGKTFCTECVAPRIPNAEKSKCVPTAPEQVTNVVISGVKTLTSLNYSLIQVRWDHVDKYDAYEVHICKTSAVECDAKDIVSRAVVATNNHVTPVPVEIHESIYFARVTAVRENQYGSTSEPNIPWKTALSCGSDLQYLLATEENLNLWDCVPCPKGSECDGPRYHDQINTREGYARVEWAPSYLSPPTKCPFPYACKGGSILKPPGDQCVNGTEGVLCSICSEGYGYSFGVCTECTIANVGLQIAIVVSIISIVVGVVYYIRKKLKKYKSVWRDLLRVVKMNFDFMQITSAVPELINIQWPPIFNQFLEYFDFVNADFISLTGASCVNGLNFNMKFLGMSSLPLIAIAFGFYIYKNLDLKNRKASQIEEEFLNNENAGSKSSRDRIRWLENHKYLEDAFHNIDTDRSGHIDVDELRLLLISFGYKVNYRMTQEILCKLLHGIKNPIGISKIAFMAGYESGKLIEILDTLPNASKNKGAVHDDKGLKAWSERRKILAKAMAETMQMLLLLHTPITKKVFLFFNCQRVYGKYFMRSDYSIQCWGSEDWIAFSPVVFLVMILFVFGFPALILFYIHSHRRILHSPQVKEKIGFLYDRFNGGAEAWEVHEIIRKTLLTGVIVFIQDPVLQASTACIICSMACCTLNYFKPHKNKLLFWIGQQSFFITLLIFIFAVVLIGSSETATEESKNVIGVLLIALNIWFVLTSFFGMAVQVTGLVFKVNKMEAMHKKTAIVPISGEEGERKSLKNAIEHVIATKTPVAARHMMTYVRESYGAASLEYAQVLIVLNDLSNDRIHNKKELERRILSILTKVPLEQKRHVDNLIMDLWLVD